MNLDMLRLVFGRMKNWTPSLATAFLAFTILLSVFLVLSVQALDQSDIQSQSILSALNYLAGNYNASMGLIHESPDSANLSNTYWLYSDNFLANLAFQRTGASNASLASLAENVTRSAARYFQGQPNPVNQYQVFTNTSRFPFNASKDFIFRTYGVAVVKSTVNNQSGMLDPKKYADIAFLEAIWYHNVRQDPYALSVFHDGFALWNGTGFKDDAFTSTFATYKIALYLYAAKLLGQAPDSSIVDGLLALQLHRGVDSGGFVTEYSGRFGPVGGSNTETTSLAILALSQQGFIPSNIVSLAFQLIIIGVLVAFAALIAATVVRRSVKQDV